MEPVGGRYCITPTLAQPVTGGGTLEVPAWYPAYNLASRPTYPRMGDQAVPAGQIDALPQRGQTTCSGSRHRFQSGTGREPDELDAMIGAAKAALGSRLLILGHHYQRDEVMRWADARGDSFGLSPSAADHPDAEFIVFCGVHFMAESADILTGAAPEGAAAGPRCRLLDGRHGRHRRGRGGLGRRSAQVVDVDTPDPGHLHELRRGPEGLRAAATAGSSAPRPTRAPCSTWALRAAASAVLFFPDQHLGRNTGVRAWATALDDMRRLEPRRRRSAA